MVRKGKKEILQKILAAVFFGGIFLLILVPIVGGPHFHEDSRAFSQSTTPSNNSSGGLPYVLVIPNATRIIVTEYFHACNVMWVSYDEFKHIANGTVVVWLEEGFFHNYVRMYAHKGWIVYATRVQVPSVYSNMTAKGNRIILIPKKW